MTTTVVPIGIDLGNSFSSIGIWMNNTATIITSDQGSTTFASCVAFTPDERIIGD